MLSVTTVREPFGSGFVVQRACCGKAKNEKE